MQRPSNTTLALLGGVAALLLILLYFTRGGGTNPDRLDDITTAADSAVTASTKACTGARVYDSLKHQLFDRAVQLRASDAGPYAQIANVAVARMENPAFESESNGAALCTGSLSIDLPPGIAASGGRRSLMGDIDYSVAADGSVSIRNGDTLVNGLASLSRSGGGISTPLAEPVAPAQPAEPAAGDTVVAPKPPMPPAPPATPSARLSVNCAMARSRSEIAVCGDAGLSALDRNMTAQYSRAILDATPRQRALLQQTRDRFVGYRDRCADARCIGDTYAGRMREIRDIMDGRWQPTR